MHGACVLAYDVVRNKRAIDAQLLQKVHRQHAFMFFAAVAVLLFNDQPLIDRSFFMILIATVIMMYPEVVSIEQFSWYFCNQWLLTFILFIILCKYHKKHKNDLKLQGLCTSQPSGWRSSQLPNSAQLNASMLDAVNFINFPCWAECWQLKYAYVFSCVSLRQVTAGGERKKEKKICLFGRVGSQHIT